LLKTLMTAVLLPIARGVNLIAMVQLAPGARLDPQVLVWAKSRGLAPATVMLPTASGLSPTLVRTTISPSLLLPTACSPKITPAVDSLAAGPDVPMPVRGTACGLPPPSSLITREAVRLPA